MSLTLWNSNNQDKNGKMKDGTDTRGIFNQRFTLSSKALLAFLIIMVFMLFSIKQGFIGLLFIIMATGQISKVTDTKYHLSIIEDEPWLTINRGRFTSVTYIPIKDITTCTKIKGFMPDSHSVFIQYGINRMITVNPKNEDGFIQAIQKLQEEFNNEKI